MICRKIYLVIYLFPTLFTISCKQTLNYSQIIINIKGAAGKKIFLYKEPFINERSIKIDSAVVVDLNHPIQFQLLDNEERLYMLRAESSSNEYYFINDVPSLHLNANDINGKYSIDYSPASLSWKIFTDSQKVLVKNLRSIEKLMKQNVTDTDSLKKIYGRQYANLLNNYISYADTVKSSAAFMAAYENIDFGNRYNDLKSFADKAVERFPGYKPIANLKKEVYDMVSIFEMECNIGDTLPVIELPDIDNKMFSTSSLKGKYYLIDFWASWCPQCLVYDNYKKQVWAGFKNRNFEMVSIALDDEKENWKKKVNQQGLVWTQLIDENMWRGSAAKTLKFDSIPFNFLVDPSGRVIRKAIKADSLYKAVAEYVKPI